jgi:hypothetical protein
MRDLGLLVGALAACAGCGRLGVNANETVPRTCLEAKPGSGTGRTLIDPDGDGLAPPREVWCEQDRRGGGWALALKIDGESSMFAGGGGMWRDPALYREDDLDPQAAGEAKLDPYINSPVAEVMLVVVDRGDVVLPLRATSLWTALASDLPIPTSVPEDEWLTAFGVTSLETGCRRQGFGMRGSNVPGVRIGLVANTEDAECRTPESFIGVGSSIPCSDNTMLAAGIASPAVGGSGAQCTPARVLVFVRDDDRTSYPPLASCEAHRAADRNDNGIYRVGNPAVPRRCAMAATGAWTNALDLDSLRDSCPDEWGETTSPLPRLCVHSVQPTEMTIAGITIPAPLASYREVRVSVIGFQLGSTDGFRRLAVPRMIDDAYLDGLSITTASRPRRHIASYAAGLQEGVRFNGDLGCPCLGGAPPPPFIGGSSGNPPPVNWRCESGSINGNDNPTLRVLDPLFDDAEVPDGCAAEASSAPIVTLLGETSGPLEARLMTDEPNTSNKEGLAVYRLELWVR